MSTAIVTIVTTPPEVTAADQAAASWEDTYEAVRAVRSDLAARMALLAELDREAEERERWAASHMDAARKRASLARRSAGLSRTAGGYVKAEPAAVSAS